MKTLVVAALILSSGLLKAQTFIQAYQDRVNQLTQANITTNLMDFEALGVKTTGSVANTNALNWLKTKYTSFGYSTAQIVEQPFTFGSTSSKNLIITKTGTLYPNTFVIICAHYDTITGPGTNDNGSGTSIVLEAAKILKDIPTEYSVKFIHFSGEEQGLWGSQSYVNTVVNATTPKMDIRLVLNLDQVGSSLGLNSNTIKCEKDVANPASNNAASATKTQELMNCVTLYSPLQPIMSNAYSSDYVPFQNNGEIITGLFETPESNYPHSAGDNFTHVDPVYVFKVGKATIGAIQHFAVASSSLAVSEVQNNEKLFGIFPNPVKNSFEIKLKNSNLKDFEFTLIDSTGKIVLKDKNNLKYDVSGLAKGVYFGTIKTSDKSQTEKIVVE